MASVIVNPGSPQAWEVVLKPGLNTVGRNPQNDICVDHPSVSSTHCQLEIRGPVVWLKDVGSTNGTFLGDDLVEEANLRLGQRFRIGEVELRLVGGQTPPPPNRPAPRPARASSVAADEPDANETDKPFPALAATAFGYPLVGDGLYVFLGGTLLYALLELAASAVRLVAFVIMIFATTYLIAFLQSVVTSSARGEKSLPDWPDLAEFNRDVLSPLLQVAGVVLFSFGPALLIRFLAPPDAGWVAWAHPAAIVFGCIYAPMAFLAVTMFDSLMALNPLLIFRSIAVVPGQYLVVVLLFGALSLASQFGEAAINSLVQIPILTNLVSNSVMLYLLLVAVRLLGLLYLSTKATLRWFSRY